MGGEATVCENGGLGLGIKKKMGLRIGMARRSMYIKSAKAKKI